MNRLDPDEDRMARRSPQAADQSDPALQCPGELNQGEPLPPTRVAVSTLHFLFTQGLTALGQTGLMPVLRPLARIAGASMD